MPTIVLLDDTPEIFGLYSVLLRDRLPGARLLLFTHPLDARRNLATLPDLLICGLNLPALDRLLAPPSSLPILLVSNHGHPPPLSQNRRVAFLARPFNLTQFNQALDRLLGPKNAF